MHSEINMIQISCPRHQRQHFDPSSDDNFISSISNPKAFRHLITTLVAVMGVYVQGTTKSLMETHRVRLCVFLATIIVHYIAFAADNMPQRYQANSSQLWGLIAVIFRSLSVVSLVSTFFTQSVAEIICYVALSCAAIIIVAYQCGRKLMAACHWLYYEILRPFLRNILNWFQAHYNNFSSTEQQRRPPVDDNFISSISNPKAFGHLITTLVAVMGVYVQGTTKPLMETHRVSLCVFLAAIIIHYIAFAADNMPRRYQANSSQLRGLIAVIFGSLSVVSLVSTFFTQSVAEIICYVALSCAAIIIVLYQCGRKLMDACHWLYHEILRPFLRNILNWFQAHYNNFSSMEQQRRPPV